MLQSGWSGITWRKEKFFDPLLLFIIVAKFELGHAMALYESLF